MAAKRVTGEDEDRRQKVYSRLLEAKYSRTQALARLDPQGKNFCVDLDSVAPGVGRELHFTALGCHGTLTAAFGRMEGAVQLGSVIGRKVIGRQRAVGAGVMRWHAAMQEAGTPTFGFLLGDNFYESGVPRTDVSTVDAMFEEGYHKVYNVLDRRELGVPYFGLLGNHDYNIHGHAVVPSEGSEMAESMERVIAEVDYTYRAGKNWNMPYRYYCVVSQVADFFVIDSSTLLFDHEQKEWIKGLYARLSTNGKWKFLMAHHGFVTFGARGAGHHALGKLARSKLVKGAARERGRGEAGVTREQAAYAAALGLTGEVNRDLFRWFVRENMHFHVNVVAHDHFTAAALLSYDAPDGSYKRTYYVLSGGGGAALGGGSLDALARLGPKLANVDLLEKKHGFSTFKVTGETVQINYRLLNGSSWEDGWDRPMTLDLNRADFWAPPRLDTRHKRLASSALRGVFYMRGAGGVFHSAAFQRRYFQLSWGDATFRYGEKPGKLPNTVDLRQVAPSSRSWHEEDGVKVGAVKGVPELWHLTFDTTSPRRSWELAVPQELFHDLCAWIDSAVPVTRSRR